ncbi:hypothetical protein [Phascolarctobacterium succinatutens]|uniref:hypothetical protein n=1 Tax=Phascolarctobacterium succinatutens TaxID=626940 RepID=UPI0026F2EEA1|nr:hypothetical protein [Phascolarctobacterium succinatutens]
MRFLAMVLLLLFSCSPVFAFQNEPDGFQGLKLNSSFEEVKSSELLCDKNYGEDEKEVDTYDLDLDLSNEYSVRLDEYYFDLDEQLQSLHGVPFKVLYFDFYKDKLYRITVCLGQAVARTEADKKLNMFYFRELQRNFTELYGSPTSTYPEQLDANDSYTRLQWEGDNAIISLRWIHDFPQLTITSVQLQNEIKEDIYKQASTEVN